MAEFLVDGEGVPEKAERGVEIAFDLVDERQIAECFCLAPAVLDFTVDGERILEIGEREIEIAAFQLKRADMVEVLRLALAIFMSISIVSAFWK